MKKLKISNLTTTGEGVASLDGYKIFVDGALPDELVEVVIDQKKKNYATAKLLNVIEPSEHRVKPSCPLFGSCGGCQIMHLDYEEQLKVKRQRVVDALERIGHIKTEVRLCVPSPKKVHYRNKIQLPVTPTGLGLYKKQSHEIISMETCLIHSEEGEEIVKRIRPFLNDKILRHVCIKSGSSEALVTLVTNGRAPDLKEVAAKILETSPLIKGVLENINTRDDNVILSQNFRLLAGRSYIFEELLRKKFRISASSFFQVNSLQAENLIKHALDIDETDHVLDAYCGVGTFSLFAAEKCASLTGIEIVSQAIADAKENARLNHITNATFLVGSAEKLVQNLGPFTVAILNPPRKGCDRALLESVVKKGVRKIIYISCDPSTMARDLSLLLASQYKIASIQPFDMFPQTMHVETIAILKLL